MIGSDESIITDLFVYGTLKRGECRESMWPRVPTRVRVGFVIAQLYDLGPYPAIRAGESLSSQDVPDDMDWVAGELWSFNRGDMDATITALDAIEQTNQRGHRNLYDRVLVRVHERPLSEGSQLALAYQYSSSRGLTYSRRMRPRSGEIVVAWSATSVDR